MSDADAEATARGVTSRAIADLVINTGLTTGAVYLKPGVATAQGVCPVCHGWAAVRSGGRAGKHPHRTALGDCPGRGQRVLTPGQAAKAGLR